MNQKALKKEFKAECKAKKTKSYRYSHIGAIVSTIGLLIVLGTLALDFGMQMFPYPLQIEKIKVTESHVLLEIGTSSF